MKHNKETPWWTQTKNVYYFTASAPSTMVLFSVFVLYNFVITDPKFDTYFFCLNVKKRLVAFVADFGVKDTCYDSESLLMAIVIKGW